MPNEEALATAPTGVLNFDILCTDVHAQAAFYHEVLGLPLIDPYLPAEDWAAIDVGGAALFLLGTENGDREPRRAPGVGGRPGLDSLALQVDDLDASVAVLDGRVDWAQDAPTVWEHPSGIAYRFRGLYDREDNLVYLSEVRS